MRLWAVVKLQRIIRRYLRRQRRKQAGWARQQETRERWLKKLHGDGDRPEMTAAQYSRGPWHSQHEKPRSDKKNGDLEPSPSSRKLKGFVKSLLELNGWRYVTLQTGDPDMSRFVFLFQYLQFLLVAQQQLPSLA